MTQNTSWKNVEKAMRNLRDKTVSEILGNPQLKESIRPAGFYIRKERCLKEVLRYCQSKIESLSLPNDTREELLDLNGIGRETADSIALYAFHQRTIPIDAYTLRLFNRFFGTMYSTRNYDNLRRLLSTTFDQEQLMEFHALIDEHSKKMCRKIPRCEECFLRKRCKKKL